MRKTFGTAFLVLSAICAGCTQRMSDPSMPAGAKIFASFTLPPHGTHDVLIETSTITSVGMTYAVPWTEIDKHHYTAGLVQKGTRKWMSQACGGGSFPFAPINGRLDLAATNHTDVPLKCVLYVVSQE